MEASKSNLDTPQPTSTFQLFFGQMNHPDTDEWESKLNGVKGKTTEWVTPISRLSIIKQ